MRSTTTPTRATKTLTRATTTLALGLMLALGAVPSTFATEPCGDFGECKVLVEINASDGDIGFHFKMDGDDLITATLRDPNGRRVFFDMARGPLFRQKLTEVFAESSEPPCWDQEGEADPDEIVTLPEFLLRWTPGTYRFLGRGMRGERSRGSTVLTFDLPAAPADVEFDGSVVSWAPGTDLGNCSDDLSDLIADGLPDPALVAVDHYEIVMEPDVEDGDPLKADTFSIRVPGTISPMEVTVSR